MLNTENEQQFCNKNETAGHKKIMAKPRQTTNTLNNNTWIPEIKHANYPLWKSRPMCKPEYLIISSQFCVCL